MNTLLAMAGLLATAQNSPSIDDVLQRSFRDATMTGRFEQVNQRELVKINKDFGTQYRVNSTKVWIKDPHKLRIESKVNDTAVLYIYNGPIRKWSVPRSRLNGTENNSDSPGKRQTFLDFGVLTPALFEDPFTAKFVRVDRASGDYVFDLTYKRPKYSDTSRHRVWVDPQKKFTTKREWYNQGGRQLATFIYENPVNNGSAWLPTRITVRNVEGKVAAVTLYDSVQINTGLADSLFAVR